MSTNQNTLGKMSNYRWTICAMLFFATTVNYLDRQVLSLTWKDFIAPEFHWTDADYGDITAVFSIVYAIANLFAGRFIDLLRKSWQRHHECPLHVRLPIHKQHAGKLLMTIRR